MDKLVAVSKAKATLNELVREAEDADVLLTRHGQIAAIIVGADRYDALLEEIEDLRDRLSVHEADPGLAVSLDKAKAELGLL